MIELKIISQLATAILLDTVAGGGKLKSMNTIHPKQHKGFTLVELLIVIVIIGILAAISIVSYNGVIGKARDSQRAQDMATIKKALMMYDTDNGGVRRTTAYNPASGYTGGWDDSSKEKWLEFLNEEYGKMPVDPVNKKTTSDPNGASTNRVYFYFCYTPTGTNNPDPGIATVRIGYFTEENKKINIDFEVSSCI